MKETAAYIRTSLFLSVAVINLAGCLDKESTQTPFAETPPPALGSGAPAISGSPQTAVMIGNIYSFQPSASDPDGDDLNFQIVNKPSWAEFDQNTGRLSGAPTISDVGLFDEIVISVSDGSLSSTLPEFSVEVVQSALGSVTLSWSPPVQNSDGSPLTDLAGYKIVYGESRNGYSNEIDIQNPSISTYVVENLVPKTYYFASKSYNSSGIESDYSNDAMIVIE